MLKAAEKKKGLQTRGVFISKILYIPLIVVGLVILLQDVAVFLVYNSMNERLDKIESVLSERAMLAAEGKRVFKEFDEFKAKIESQDLENSTQWHQLSKDLSNEIDNLRIDFLKNHVNSEKLLFERINEFERKLKLPLTPMPEFYIPRKDENQEDVDKSYEDFKNKIKE